MKTTQFLYLNTSYVDIKLKWKAYMLLGMNDLNTSYVDIKLLVQLVILLIEMYLNTSYVDIKRATVLQ